MASERVNGSFRDPSGFVFTREGTLYRQVNQSYRAEFDAVETAGLFDRLWEKGLLVRHQAADLALAADPQGAYRVIQPDRVPFISYPYEWSFSMYQAAALATLDIQAEALAMGFSLKDASAYNIQFVDGRPVFIDTLSFERHEDGRPWVAYRQFCQHFLAPLALMAGVDIRMSALMKQFIDGIPLDLASRLLPMRKARPLPSARSASCSCWAFSTACATRCASSAGSRRAPNGAPTTPSPTTAMRPWRPSRRASRL
jgi:hypothetical protein